MDLDGPLIDQYLLHCNNGMLQRNIQRMCQCVALLSRAGDSR